MLQRRTSCALLLSLLASIALANDQAPPFTKVDLECLPVNTWVQVGNETDRNKYLSSTWYMPATDEFIMWGKTGGGREVFDKYDVESFDLGSYTWHDSLPIGKEKSWAGGMFPNWTNRSHSPRGKYKMPILKDVGDYTVGGSAAVNRVLFVEADGISRPTRCPTFHQATYDTKRNRMLFFVGGKTFSYDPVKRIWLDLKPTKIPLTCDALVWASLCYEPVNDEVVLFGGGQALNPTGGAPTWIYDCARNEWYRPKLKVEPPLRCNARMVYDSRNKLIVLFGGDAQSHFLNDTWVYDVTRRRWSEKKPGLLPPPVGRYGACFIEKQGLVLLCGTEEAPKTCFTWTYDAGANVWAPVKGTIPTSGWLSCGYSPKDDVVVLCATGSRSSARRTYLYRLTPDSARDERKGMPAGSIIWKHANQMESLKSAPPADPKATLEKLKTMPVNQWVDANPPGTLINKTWSTAVCDTDRGEVIYTGGGHSGYSGNDVAHYSVGDNRWYLSWPPCFPPFLESTNSTVFGWSYGFRFWSQHTYRWYTYDPKSKTVVYCARPMSNMNGKLIQLDEDPANAFTYEPDKHRNITWVYDPAKRKLYPPNLGRPFGNPWHLALVGTPKGIYALHKGSLYHGTVKAGKITWKLVDDNGPVAKSDYNYEWQPLVYDSKRNRLLHFMGKGTLVEVHTRKLDSKSWTKLDTSGTTEVSREVVYVPSQDAVIALGKGKLFVMDCATNHWRQLDVEMPAGGYGMDASMVHDPVHDVCVLLLETRFAGPNRTYLFRYDATSAKYKEEQ